MIHAYLMRHNLELESEDYHCENFERKRIEINAKANLNITVSPSQSNNDNNRLSSANGNTLFCFSFFRSIMTS